MLHVDLVLQQTIMEEQRRPVRTRPPSFKMEIPGNEQKKLEISVKMQKIRGCLVNTFNRPVNNCDIIDSALDFWIQSHVPDQDAQTFPTQSKKLKNKKDSNENMFVSTVSSIQKLTEMTEHHGRNCRYNLKQQKVVYRGHVIIVTLQCGNTHDSHTYRWTSSPYLPNDTFLVNHRINHAFVCSGMLPVHYTRFSKASGFGVISKSKRKTFLQSYGDSLQTVYNNSLEESLHLEIGSYDELDGIDIMTDARHGWRKNAKDSSVLALGEKTHKVLQCIHVTKADDIVSQRHELKGTQKIYENFDSKDVTIKVHTHDRNLSINKLAKSRPMTTNQNDCWHGVKSLKKALKVVSSGPKYKEGKTWFDQLYDKAEPIATHIHWAMRNCQNDPERLRNLLSNIVKHYRDEHSDCPDSSRCKEDSKYEPSRMVITNPKAEKCLEKVIQASVIYKHPEDFVLARDSSYVESFNNVMNIFQDKRICFSNRQYNMRSQLAVLHWNENVDRQYTSISNPRDPRAPRRRLGKKVYKAVTYRYRNNIWDTYMTSMFAPQRRRRGNI